MPTNTILQLASAASNIKSPIVFFIHPVEGLVEALKPLATLLPYTVYGIECDEKAPADSLIELAKYYIEVSFDDSIGGSYVTAIMNKILNFIHMLSHCCTCC